MAEDKAKKTGVVTKTGVTEAEVIKSTAAKKTTAKSKTSTKAKTDTETKNKANNKDVAKGKLSKILRTGTEVEITIGKDAGKSGKIKMISKDRQHVFVEGLNTRLDYQKNRLTNESLGKTAKEAKLHISNIKLTN